MNHVCSRLLAVAVWGASVAVGVASGRPFVGLFAGAALIMAPPFFVQRFHRKWLAVILRGRRLQLKSFHQGSGAAFVCREDRPWWEYSGIYHGQVVNEDETIVGGYFVARGPWCALANPELSFELREEDGRL
jgi:hypothetical protein